jgi:predicted acetyltransferase
MKPIQLRELLPTDEIQFELALNEPWESDFIFAHYFESLAENTFKKYVSILPDIKEGLHIPDGHVPSTVLFAFNDAGKIVGRVSIRHQLSEQLINIGGHVGYGVTPSERRKGYATEILKLTVCYLKDTHPELDRILLTCDETNVGSIKTIESNGGEMENVFKTPQMTIGKRRYWINL